MNPSTSGVSTLAPIDNSKRIQKEYFSVLNEIDKNEYIHNLITADDADMTTWFLLIEGPPGTPYEGGFFKLNIFFPENYPFRPPSVFFFT